MSNETKEEESITRNQPQQSNPPPNAPPALPAVVGALNAIDLDVCHYDYDLLICQNVTEETLQEAEAHLEDLVKRKRKIDKQLVSRKSLLVC